MPTIAVQVAFTSATNVPSDVVTNTWHFNDEAGLSNPLNMVNLVWDFYTESYTGAEFPLTFWMSDDAYSGEAVIRLYNLSDPKPRVPILEEARTFTPSTSNTLPTEVAVCLSYHAAPVSGISQARRRGRIYLGPLTTNAAADGRPAPALVTSMCVSASELLAASNASLNERWVVWSEVAQQASDVVGGWVDNAFDTQRRRGWDATSRQLWVEA